MPGNLSLEDLTTAIDLGEIDTVVVAQTDMQGRLMGKRFHARHFLDAGLQGTHACNYLLTVDMEMEPVPGFRSASWAQGYGDYAMRPDLSTLRRTPWAEGTALVLCDVLDHHGRDEIAVSPRAILKRQIARARAMGFEPMMATEPEFYLFRESVEEATAKGWRDLTPISAYNEDYHVFQTAKEEGVMRALRNGLHAAGVPVETTKGEAWAGQAEINFRYGPALDTADDHALLKTATKEIAWKAGHAVTFMAKYADAPAGSSCHIHQSLTRDGAPAFHDPADPHGMSATMRGYLAGLLAHAAETALLLAPNINSYKRFVAGTFAPTRMVWSRDNRTAGFRVCGEGTRAVRVECRIGGADLNPYLALAGQLAAGLSGVEQGLTLEAAFEGDAYAARRAREIPRTLRDAARAFRRSAMLRDALGAEVVEHYAHAADWEQAEHDRRVTDWEVARGFERS